MLVTLRAPGYPEERWASSIRGTGSHRSHRVFLSFRRGVMFERSLGCEPRLRALGKTAFWVSTSAAARYRLHVRAKGCCSCTKAMSTVAPRRFCWALQT